MTVTSLAIIGLGLIGGSIAKAVKQANPDCQVIASDLNPTVITTAISDGTVDAELNSETLSHADIILVAIPSNAYPMVLEKIKAAIKPQQLIMEVASVKQPIVETIQQSCPHLLGQFVLTHPMCGAEQGGYQAAKADLFQKKNILLSPLAQTNAKPLQQAHQFWQLLGGHCVELSVQLHDQVVSQVSHLPHAIAYAFMRSIQHNNDLDVKQYAGTGFHDFTRIAHSPAPLWTQICLANREQLLQDMQSFQLHFQQLAQLLIDNDAESLQTYLQECIPD